ncbi:MAG TPA: hypothetical protein PKU72_09675, partial [Smithellaceae bacterium]|nr:hypothetical protein [Smithellaceae bacterium]
ITAIFVISTEGRNLSIFTNNEQPRRKQRGIVEGNPLIISPQGAGNLPVEIKISRRSRSSK